jgi:hypothetical protein
MRTPDIELQWWDGCPSTENARAELRDALDELGLSSLEPRMTEIASDEEARALRFPGSPTILIDGRDAVPPLPGDPIGLTCRVYRRRDGSISPVPDSQDLRDALRRALAPHAEVSR